MPTLDHIGLSVADLDAQLAWYCRALGWRTASRFAIAAAGLRGGFLVSDDGQAIELLERRGASGGLRAPDPQTALQTLGYGHVCIRVDDTDAWHARLLAAGATERQAPGAAPEAGVRFSFVADPEGNLIELLDRHGPVGAARTTASDESSSRSMPSLRDLPDASRAGAVGAVLRRLLERLERWASGPEQAAEDHERAHVDRLAAECFWGDPRMMPSARRQ